MKNLEEIVQNIEYMLDDLAHANDANHQLDQHLQKAIGKLILVGYRAAKTLQLITDELTIDTQPHIHTTLDVLSPFDPEDIRLLDEMEKDENDGRSHNDCAEVV